VIEGFSQYKDLAQVREVAEKAWRDELWLGTTDFSQLYLLAQPNDGENHSR